MKRLIEALARSRTLDKKTRTRANAALVKAGLDGNKSFREVGEAIAVIFSVLQKEGIEQDEVLNAQRYSGDKGQHNIDLAFSNPDDSFSPIPISNSMLSLQWYKRESGTYEVVAYLS